MIYLYLILIALIVFSIRKQKVKTILIGETTTKKVEAFSKDNSLALKGLFALCVILHHLGQNSNLGGLFGRLNGLLGGIAVGGFFFLSAYGLIKSYNKNPDGYAKRMLLVKIPLLYVIQVVINLIYYLVFFINSGISAGNIVLQIFNLDIFANLPRLNGYSWFITTILFIYIFFTIAILILKLFKKLKHKKLFIIIITSILILGYFFVFRFVPSLSTLYFRAIFCFILGLFYGCYFEKINQWLTNKWVWIVSICSLIISIILLYFFFPEEQIISLLICVLLIVASQKITFENSKPLKFLGEISLEIYLLQYLCICLLSFDFSSLQFIKGLAIYGTTIIVAYFFHVVYKEITIITTKVYRKRIEKKKQKQIENNPTN